MLISVIVPVYRVENFLSTCIESILNQSLKDFELILVDDGSPDFCGHLCDIYETKDSRIKTIHKTNGGLSSARNAGLDIAKGDFIAFVDSDDFIFPNYLEVLYNACKRYNAEISCCKFIRCSESDKLNNFKHQDVSNEIEVFNDNKMEVFLTTKKINTVAWGKLYKKEIFKNLKFPEGKLHEDVFTTHIAIHRAKKIAVCEYIGYAYRINFNSIVNESFSKKKLDLLEGFCLRSRFIEKNYPNLKRKAYSGIIYSCNQILLSMAMANFYDISLFNKLKNCYRKYAIYYIQNKNCTIAGKIIAGLSFVNIKVAFFIIRFSKKFKKERR